MSAAVADQAQSDPQQLAATTDYGTEAQPLNIEEGEKHKEKKRLFGLLKKKDKDSAATSKNKDASSSSPDATPTASPPAMTPAKQVQRSVSPGPQSEQPHMTPPSTATAATYFPTTASASSPPTNNPSMSAAASPSRYIRSSSPRLHSPASSLIFERNVQEAPLPDDLQAAIPHHIQTEDYIPPILEASSHAITDERLNPDEVEIVMHSAHQPAASGMPSSHPEGGVGSGGGALSPLSLGQGADTSVPPIPALSPAIAMSESTTSLDDQASQSHYGSLDATDVRRLSFISFADVVQGEHAHDGTQLPKDLHMSMLSQTSNRSPSPVRSPASSHAGVVPGESGLSPPTSGAPSMKGVDIASGKQSQPMIGAFPGSPGSLTAVGAGTQSPSLGGGELHVETMRQALRKTGSGDLSHARNPVSPVERSSSVLFGGSPEAK